MRDFHDAGVIPETNVENAQPFFLPDYEKGLKLSLWDASDGQTAAEGLRETSLFLVEIVYGPKFMLLLVGSGT